MINKKGEFEKNSPFELFYSMIRSPSAIVPQELRRFRVKKNNGGVIAFIQSVEIVFG